MTIALRLRNFDNPHLKPCKLFATGIFERYLLQDKPLKLLQPSTDALSREFAPENSVKKLTFDEKKC
jgi:hypothetical protein